MNSNSRHPETPARGREVPSYASCPTLPGSVGSRGSRMNSNTMELSSKSRLRGPVMVQTVQKPYAQSTFSASHPLNRQRKINDFALWGHLDTRKDPKGSQGGPNGAKESPFCLLNFSTQLLVRVVWVSGVRLNFSPLFF